MVLEIYEQDFDRYDYSKCTSSLDVELSKFKVKKHEAFYRARIIKKKIARKFR